MFPVHRYLGDEEAAVSAEPRSQLLLSKLQQKAKEKRQSRARETEAGERRKRDAGGLPEVEDGTSGNEKLREGDLSDPVVSAGGGAWTERQGSEVGVPAGVTVLGGFESKPVQKVSRVLPEWLAEPDVVHKDIRRHLVPVSDVAGLGPLIQKVLQKNQVHHLFPVQAEVIPAILAGAQQGVLTGPGGYRPRDICVSAPTGSGKTLCFVLPVIQVLMQRVVCEVRALAVLPTKELAQQVYRAFVTYAEGTTLRVALMSGQRSFAAEEAALTEERGGMRHCAVDIVVATPGRLVDHINKNSAFSLQHLRYLIIDEADRMIDSMHQSWLSEVVKAVYRPETGPKTTTCLRPDHVLRRTDPSHITAASLATPLMPLQKLLFSATLTQNPEKLQLLSLHQPRLFSSAHGSTSSVTHHSTPGNTDGRERYDFPQGLTEYYVPCTLSRKPLLILHFLLRLKLRPILCFTNSRETAHRLFLLVRQFGGIRAAEFSSRLSAADRKRALKDFEKGSIQLLVSTDAAARGIDISGVKCVVNYDAPQFIRTYIHRIGRTARAGKVGLAFTFLLNVQERNFLQMVQEAGSSGIQKQMINPASLQSMEERYEETLQQLAAIVKAEKGLH